MSNDKIDRTDLLDQKFIRACETQQFPAARVQVTLAESGLDQATLIDLFRAQCLSRHLDFKARELKLKNQGYYTIGSCGHEGNAAIAQAFRVSDMAFLHYRSAAFMLQRAKQSPDIDMVHDILLSLLASSEDPISSGRHKVFGSLALNTPPQTSTIASHLPKAVGAAASIKRAELLGLSSKLAKDAVILCSFGDASINHASALAALNSAQWMAHKHYPLPLVFICEDNGIGISVPVPGDWVESMFAQRQDMEYVRADGLNLLDTYRAAINAARIARTEKKPVFLHMKCVRLLGHAGSDFELMYRELAAVEADEANDPLLHSARILIENQCASAEQVLAMYEAARQQVVRTLQDIGTTTKLESVETIQASLIPPVAQNEIAKLPSVSAREQAFGSFWLKLQGKLNLSQSINAALTDLMLQYSNVIVFGEDVGKKGGVYRVTADLQQRFGLARVFDTLLDETSILGYAIGHAHNDFIPIPEIQFLAYLHNAEDQLRGEAATLSFFSSGQFTNPMVVRIAGLAYQKGFGGHFHNDNSIAVLRDIPGIIIAVPSNGRDAVLMLRKCLELAYREQRVVVFIEPIALYMEKDLHQKGDGLWSFPYPDLAETIEFEPAIYGDSKKLAIITYGNGTYLSLQAAKLLQAQDQIEIQVIDLRWLAPLNIDAIIAEVEDVEHILIVDECRRTGSVSEAIVAVLAEQLQPLPNLHRITAEDCFIPLGDAWKYVLPSRDQIVEKVKVVIASE